MGPSEVKLGRNCYAITHGPIVDAFQSFPIPANERRVAIHLSAQSGATWNIFVDNADVLDNYFAQMTGNNLTLRMLISEYGNLVQRQIRLFNVTNPGAPARIGVVEVVYDGPVNLEEFDEWTP